MNYGIGNVKGGGGVSNTMLTTTTDATENSGTYTLDLTYLSETPKVNDYIVYVNSGNLTTLYQVSAVGSTEATLTKVGDIGGSSGGTTLYQHNIMLEGQIGSGYLRCIFTIINDSNLPFVKSSNYVSGTNQDLQAWFNDNGFNATYLTDVYDATTYLHNGSLYIGIGAGSDNYFYTIANPTLARLQITNTTITDTIIELGEASINSGGGGSQKYQHNIYMYNGTTREISLTIINDDDTPIDKTALKTFLEDNGFTYYRNPYKCVANYDSSVYVGICVSSNDLSLSRLGSGQNIESITFTINDTIIAL